MATANLIENPRAALNLAGIFGEGGNLPTIERSALWSRRGGWSVRASRLVNAASTSSVTYKRADNSLIPVVGGRRYSVLALVYVPEVIPGTVGGLVNGCPAGGFHFYLPFANAGGAETVIQNPATAPALGLHVLRYTVTAPADAVGLRVRINTSFVAGEVGKLFEWYVGFVGLVEGELAPEADGDVPGYQWTGAPHASPTAGRPAPALKLPTRVGLSRRLAVPRTPPRVVNASKCPSVEVDNLHSPGNGWGHYSGGPSDRVASAVQVHQLADGRRGTKSWQGTTTVNAAPAGAIGPEVQGPFLRLDEVLVGRIFSVALSAKVASAPSPCASMRLYVNLYSAPGVFLLNIVSALASSIKLNPAHGAWHDLMGVFRMPGAYATTLLPPDTRVKAMVVSTFNAPVPNGQYVVRGDALRWELGATTPQPYADGEDAGLTWAGVPHKSETVERLAPELALPSLAGIGVREARVAIAGRRTGVTVG